MKKKIFVILAIVSIMMGSSSIVNAAGCGNWETVSCGSNYCHNTWCYNIIFWNGSWGHDCSERRLCVDENNMTYWEYRNVTYWSGCC